MTRDLQLLQTNILQLHVGLWSGNKRKIEIAESHGLPLITVGSKVELVHNRVIIDLAQDASPLRSAKKT